MTALPPAGGLRRFARPAATATPASSPLAGAPVGLPRIGTRARDDSVEHCEMCGETLPAEHGHLVEVEKRSIACACRGCYLLFTADGAGGGHYRAIPRRFHVDPSSPLTLAEFDTLGVPVSMVFFFHNSPLGRVVGCYPSPGGATECEVDLEAYAELAAVHPLLASAEPDVEAVLLDRRLLDGAGGRIDAYLLPIDACYALVGRIRLLWSGFDGGDEVHEALDAFRADLRLRSTPLAQARQAEGA